ncbi:MAG: hypothetical protein NWQ45_12740 [Congregibacter sp.]|nr:hypothetical protein [Congregibacter sp.]
MTAAEAHELALMHLQFGHSLGEAIMSTLQFWVSVSYGVLILAFIAPQALNRVTTPLILTLYVVFSVTQINDVGYVCFARYQVWRKKREQAE